MKLTPIREIGGGRKMTLNATYDQIVAVLGEPNVTDMYDPDKVKASWGFEDEIGRTGFVWCYHHIEPRLCKNWSVDGNMHLLRDLFPEGIM
jgi:hypothetical protein